MQTALLWAASGTGFTFLMTTLGAASVFLFRKRNSMAIQRAFLGFAAGVMIAASVWSLLIPAIERAEEAGQVGWIPAAGGFVIGVAFLMVLHQLLPHLHPGESKPEGLPSKWERPTLLFTAVTLHNIPEGMSVGLLFAMAAQNGGDPGMFGMACLLYTSTQSKSVTKALQTKKDAWTIYDSHGLEQVKAQMDAGLGGGLQWGQLTQPVGGEYNLCLLYTSRCV